MQQAPTREIKILKGPGQIKVNISLTPEVRQEAMINPEVMEVTKMAQEIMKEAGLNPRTGLILRLKVASDVANLTTNHRTVTSKRRHA
jgi:hypothetical protein